MKNSTERFSDRVENYLRYRPSYPMEVVEELRSWCRITEDSTIADVGSGTGILTKLFLDRGFKVIGIEPNRPMREAAEIILYGYAGFTSVNGTAENTGLDTNSVDPILAGQSFHWIDQTKSKREFQRVLSAGGQVALIWNQRKHDTSAFMREYESLLERRLPDYHSVNHRNVDDESISRFFGSSSYQAWSFPNFQRFDFEGLKGRCFSSSYTPSHGSTEYEGIVSELEAVFQDHHKNGLILFEYETTVQCGTIAT